ncbi:MAG TPA: hypothetical protein PKK69_01590 [Ferruginibacter sp.]|nr:hypothetical protein [Ferruginibacter sp.]
MRKGNLMRLLMILLVANHSESISAQKIRALNNNVSSLLDLQGKAHDLVKFSIFSSPYKGTSFGFSYGLWREGPLLQYSLNTGFMWRFGKGFLGNYRNGAVPHDKRTRCQLVFMVSPILTTRLSNQLYAYQEIEPFYYGTPNAIFSRYKHSLSLGSTFTISPRGTYRNITTIRNRAQQVFMIGLNVGQFNFTLYDDFFPIMTDKLQLGENWDRFFTGGGFIRFRFNDQFTAHLYSEVYTGINRANSFLYPDLIGYRKKGRSWVRKNYAHQDPGQEYFNNSWFLLRLSYSSSQQQELQSGFYMPDLDVLVGTSKPWTMFSQNWIHNMFSPDKENGLKLHYFLPRTNVPGNLEAGSRYKWRNFYQSLFVGAGMSYNFLTF